MRSVTSWISLRALSRALRGRTSCRSHGDPDRPAVLANLRFSIAYTLVDAVRHARALVTFASWSAGRCEAAGTLVAVPLRIPVISHILRLHAETRVSSESHGLADSAISDSVRTAPRFRAARFRALGISRSISFEPAGAQSQAHPVRAERRRARRNPFCFVSLLDCLDRCQDRFRKSIRRPEVDKMRAYYP